MATATTTHRQDPDRDRWLTRLARAGYATRGVVYVLVGVLALMAAFGNRGDAAGEQDALATLTDNTGGQILLVLIGIGLFGFALWRFCQAVYDADHHGSDGKGMAIRAAFMVGAVMAVLLGVFALSLAFGHTTASAASDGGSSQQGWIAALMSKPYGVWLIGIAGVLVAAFGIAQFVRAVRATFMRRLDMPADVARKVEPMCKAGFVARGIVFLIIGGFLAVAALQHDPSEARGLEGALETVQQQAYGPWLLALVALGLLGFAIYNFIAARYRRIHPPDEVIPRVASVR